MTAPTAALGEEEVRRYRADTPATADRIHLNNAGASLPPRPVLDAMLGHLKREAELGGYEAAEAAEAECEAVYGDVAALLACRAENVALVDNATVAFAQALSAFPFRPGDLLVTSESDYPSNRILYEALAARSGVEVRIARDLPAGGIDPGAVAELVKDPRCKVVAISWIPTSSGLIQRVEEVGEVCAAAGVPYVIDGCQAVGQLPIDVSQLRCDYLGATARKFLRGPRGIGFLYVSDRALARGDYPLAIDMRGASLKKEGGLDLVPSAKRFENWEFSYALVLGLGEAARYARAVGVERASARALAHAAYLRERLAGLPGVTVADRGERLAAIVTAAVSGRVPREIVLALRAAGINVNSVNAPAPEGNGVRQVLRISPHYYNTREELDAALSVLAGELAGVAHGSNH